MTKPVKAQPAKAQPKAGQVQKKEGNKYDKIFKENLKALLPFFLAKIILLEQGCQLKNLPQIRLQTTTEKEPDFIRKVVDILTKVFRILHIEFEAKDSPKTDGRMLSYFSMLFEIFECDIEQHLIYLLAGKPTQIKGELTFKNVFIRYKIHCITDFSYLEFIDSNVPEEVLMSVLANPGDKTGAEIVSMILQQLVKICGNTSAIRKFVKQLKILSMLRNLRVETIKQTNKMNLIISTELIEADEWYKEGVEKGLEKGLKKGLKNGLKNGLEKGLGQGLEQGKLLLSIVAVRNMLKQGFTTQRIAPILDIEHDLVLTIQKQLTKEKRILALLAEGKSDVAGIAKRVRVFPGLVEILKKEVAPKP